MTGGMLAAGLVIVAFAAVALVLGRRMSRDAATTSDAATPASAQYRRPTGAGRDDALATG